MTNYKPATCYHCKTTGEYNIPFLSKEFIAHKFVCENCGHDQIQFKPRDPERQEQLNEAFRAIKKDLENDK